MQEYYVLLVNVTKPNNKEEDWVYDVYTSYPPFTEMEQAIKTCNKNFNVSANYARVEKRYRLKS